MRSTVCSLGHRSVLSPTPPVRLAEVALGAVEMLHARDDHQGDMKNDQSDSEIRDDLVHLIDGSRGIKIVREKNEHESKERNDDDDGRDGQHKKPGGDFWVSQVG